MTLEKSSRENRSPTTFWMEKELKIEAQKIAQKINISLTDLINKSVQNYLDRGFKQDDEEMGKKIAAAVMSHDIRESGIYENKINEINSEVRGLVARVNEMENRMEKFSTSDDIDTKIRRLFELKVDPIINRLSDILENIQKN
ncbi:MAG: hypothetical protein OEZ01_01770 [Candidatus Heimdallarchaeota archaeon]|nr:hypothetical protein [Candidatus Heimdallarchaeota archaeon]MDH5644701.1 hypothetical protein [Candidatus Heimdallarchaeota archaeon]